MSRRSQAFKRRKIRNTSPIAIRGDIAWWHPVGIKANNNKQEIDRLLREDRERQSEEGKRFIEEVNAAQIPWERVAVATTLKEMVQLIGESNEAEKMASGSS